ncbi:MAG: hypothetical protein FWG66_16255 [Spirochaetes bacterium]|nr:hypothetical protein [Spirochaetota bacterium]
MAYKEKAAVFNKLSFGDVVDETCERLMEKQVKHCIQRICEMQNSLAVLERELDEFIAERPLPAQKTEKE